MDHHFRAEEVALWTWLVPNLEKLGSRHGPNSSHHRFFGGPAIFSGPTRPNFFVPPYPTTSPLPNTSKESSNNKTDVQRMTHGFSVRERQSKNSVFWDVDLITYSTALTLTAAIAATLFILNIFVIAAMHYNRKNKHNKQPTVSPRTSPSHCGTINSSSTTIRSIAQEWPPEYSACFPDNSTHLMPKTIQDQGSQDNLDEDNPTSFSILPRHQYESHCSTVHESGVDSISHANHKFHIHSKTLQPRNSSKPEHCSTFRQNQNDVSTLQNIKKQPNNVKRSTSMRSPDNMNMSHLSIDS